MNSDNDYLDYLSSVFGLNGSFEKIPQRTDAQELDDLWNEYTSYVNELKAEGYRVLRNENGKHKVVKGNNYDI